MYGDSSCVFTSVLEIQTKTFYIIIIIIIILSDKPGVNQSIFIYHHETRDGKPHDSKKWQQHKALF